MACRSGSERDGRVMPIPKTRKSFRHAKPDRAATKEFCFLDSRSFIDVYGRRFLAGEDVGVMRDAVFARDDFRCTRCGSGRGLQMHHKRSRGLGGDDSLENLQTLCAACHGRMHVQVHLGAA